MFTNSNGAFDQIACPGDPAPPSYPDGTIYSGLVDGFCSVVGSGGPLGFPTMYACFMYSYLGGNDEYEQNKAGYW
ncbi:hypothetical protein V8F33_013111 [Rhypophila sp. PSN 637]